MGGAVKRQASRSQNHSNLIARAQYIVYETSGTVQPTYIQIGLSKMKFFQQMLRAENKSYRVKRVILLCSKLLPQIMKIEAQKLKSSDPCRLLQINRWCNVSANDMKNQL